MAASSKASSSASGLKLPAMDDAAGAAAAVSKASKGGGGGRGAFLAHFFLVLSVLTLCAVVYVPRFFVVSGPAQYGAGAIVAIISSAPRPSSSTSRTPSSSAAPAPPLGGQLEHGAGRGGGAAAADQEHGGALNHQQQVVLDNQVGSPCSSLPSHTICCDRSDYHSDVCFMSGDVRTDAASLSLLLFPPPQGQGASSSATTTAVTEERIRPYTRKWDAYITKTIHEVRLRRVVEAAAGAAHRCDVRHDAPVFVVTAGGYSHNMFHVFNDGFLPLWLTAQHLRRRVVLAVLSYSPRWAGTYGEILSGLSGYHVIDLLRDRRTHCFPGAVVGTRYHDYLAVNSTRLRDNRTIVDFHDFLAGVYDDDGGGGGSSRSSSTTEETTPAARDRRPRLGIVSRKGRRVIENQAAVAALAASVGFDVDVMETATGVPLSAVYASVSSYDALVGVHGADLTAFLFLRPAGGAALVQIAPLGIAMLSRNLFGVPAARMGLRYEQYDVSARESSLSRKYPAGHVVVADPARARREQGKQEWELVEHVYLRGQNVSLDLGRFRETLARIHSRLLKERQQRHVSTPDASPQI